MRPIPTEGSSPSRPRPRKSPEARITRPRARPRVRERLELIQLEPANVVEVHLDALGPRLGRLLEDLRRRDAPGLEPQVPAERVGAQTDGH